MRKSITQAEGSERQTDRQLDCDRLFTWLSKNRFFFYKNLVYLNIQGPN